MSLIHIDNCARQIINLAEKGKPFQNLNVYDGEPVTQNDFCTKLAGILNTDVSPVSMKKFIFKYGRTTAQALNSSVPMTTLYPRLHEYDTKSIPDTWSAIFDVVSFLKNKQRILSESPHEGLI
jgi:nucleoside-diphosphate-sugar epimerase